MTPVTRTQLRKTWARRLGIGAVALAVISGCFYSFDNPVEKYQPGSIAGAVQLVNAVGGQTTLGGHVSVPFTNGLSLTLNTFGKFLFQDLPDGTYSLYVDIPPLAGNDYPLLLLRSGISMPEVEGATDSLEIGTLSVPASGIVGGTVSPPQAGIVVAAFVPTSGNVDAGLGVYEGFSTSTDATGHYEMPLPAGAHVLAASDPFDNALATASIQPAATLNIDLNLQATNLTGLITGQLVGSDFGASATGSPIPGSITFTATANGAQLASGLLIPSPDESPQAGGSTFNVDVPGGNLVTLALMPPATAATDPCDEYAPFTLPPIPVIAGYDTQLGQVTWLNQRALGANGIGPCVDGGSGTTPGGDGGTDGGTLWLDAGSIPWDGGEIAQTLVLPLTSDGGRLVAWVAGQAGATNLYYASSANGYKPVALTIGGNVSPGSISGTPLNDGVLLTYSTYDSTSSTASQFISPVNGPAGAVQPNFPANPSLGVQQTATFLGSLDDAPGVFVLQPVGVGDAGIVGAFGPDGQSFPASFTLLPAGSAPIVVYTLIATSCDVADFAGDAGFCLAGSGTLQDADAGSQFVAFISSVLTNAGAPTIANTQILSNQMTSPIYVGLAPLPGQIAVSAGTFGSPVTYWQLSSLASPPGAGIQAPPETDLLINWDNRILGLSFAHVAGTAGIFLPDGGQTPTILGIFNGASDLVTAYYEPSTDSIITGGVSLDEADNEYISVFQLPNQ